MFSSFLSLVFFQNADLTQEARTTRSLRDELDIIKEKVSVCVCVVFFLCVCVSVCFPVRRDIIRCVKTSIIFIFKLLWKRVGGKMKMNEPERQNN